MTKSADALASTSMSRRRDSPPACDSPRVRPPGTPRVSPIACRLVTRSFVASPVARLFEHERTGLPQAPRGSWPTARAVCQWFARPVRYLSSAVSGYRRRGDFDGLRGYVMFVGHLLERPQPRRCAARAYPDVVVAHELDALGYLDAGYRRSQLRAAGGPSRRTTRPRGGPRVATPTPCPVSRVAGGASRSSATRGAQSTSRLAADPGLLDRLEAEGGPVTVIQVVRNPYDNIATIWRRQAAPRRAHRRLPFACGDHRGRPRPDGLGAVRARPPRGRHLRPASL